MKYISRAEHYEKLKRPFRSAAKQTAYDYLVSKIWETRRSIRTNKDDLMILQKKQGLAKQEYKALQALLREFK